MNIRRRGFTLIELLVVLAIVALLATMALPRYLRSVDLAKDAVLQENLRLTRETIDKFYGDTRRFPDSLDELVERRYLRTLPVDPVTESSTTWVIVAPVDGLPGSVYDIRSGAPGARQDGVPYADL